MQQRGFFVHNLAPIALGATFTLQNEQNHGLQLFCPDSHAMPPLLQKLAMPLQPHRPASFCSFSPEADLLRKNTFFILSWVAIS
ncbi:hypothetical protein [Mucilaginibacter rubeus]|uniref:hypothetical protein n=1 Tax=Mucilaginibacter rubeus TaxID=2027860 RepID=UPI00166BC1FF|nr:hypothetical protein [Mucilaginibacter rubeus]